jgi:phytoene synthase
MTVQECAEIVERGDPDRLLAAMTAPVPDREVLFPLYAFNLEIARAPWLTQEPLIAEMRLQFWRDVLDEVEQGKPPRAHEVVAPLADAIHARAIPLAPLRGMIDARRADIAREPFVAPADLWDYINAGAGALMFASVAALGRTDEAEARVLGRVQGLAAWLEAQPELAAHGWRAFDPAFYPEMIDMALAELATIKGHDFGKATPAARTASRARGILKRAKADPDAITEGRLEESEFARRGRFLWKTLRGRW